MKKILLVLQGNITNNSLNYARTFKNLDLDILLVIWDNKSKFISDEDLIIERLIDPKSITTKDNKNFINANRQIAAMKFVLEKYSNCYDFIVKMRNDIFLEKRNKFKRSLLKASKLNKIWTIGNQTGSPRFFSPLLLNYHVSDWFFGGKPSVLKKKLQLDLIDEKQIILKKPLLKRNLIFWRKASNEQIIWKKAWQFKSKNKIYRLKINDVGTKPNLKKCFANAKYLADNYFISNFRDIGLQSTKYPINPVTFYRNRYYIFQMGKIETFLINKRFIILSVFYVPFIRFIIYYTLLIFKRNRLRF